MTDMNGIEIKKGCRVMCVPSNEVRKITKSKKEWVKGLIIQGAEGSWVLNELRASKMTVLTI